LVASLHTPPVVPAVVSLVADSPEVGLVPWVVSSVVADSPPPVKVVPPVVGVPSLVAPVEPVSVAVPEMLVVSEPVLPTLSLATRPSSPQAVRANSSARQGARQVMR